MPCPHCSDDLVIPLPVFMVAYLETQPFRRSEYFAGPIWGWVTDWREGNTYCTQEEAKAVRDAIGRGVVLRVYDVDRDEFKATTVK